MLALEAVVLEVEDPVLEEEATALEAAVMALEAEDRSPVVAVEGPPEAALTWEADTVLEVAPEENTALEAVLEEVLALEEDTALEVAPEEALVLEGESSCSEKDGSGSGEGCGYRMTFSIG